MRRTELLQEIRKMRFEEAYVGWDSGRLTQAEAASVLGVCEADVSTLSGALRSVGAGGSLTGDWNRYPTRRPRWMNAVADGQLPPPAPGLECETLLRVVPQGTGKSQLHLGEEPTDYRKPSWSPRPRRGCAQEAPGALPWLGLMIHQTAAATNGCRGSAGT